MSHKYARHLNKNEQGFGRIPLVQILPLNPAFKSRDLRVGRETPLVRPFRLSLHGAGEERKMTTTIFSRRASPVYGYEEVPGYLAQAFRAMEIIAPPENLIISADGNADDSRRRALFGSGRGWGEMKWLPTSCVVDGARKWILESSWNEEQGDSWGDFHVRYVGRTLILDAEFQQWASDLFLNHPLARLIEKESQDCIGTWFSLVLPPGNDPREWEGVEVVDEQFGRMFEVKWGRCRGHIVVRLGVNPPKTKK